MSDRTSALERIEIISGDITTIEVDAIVNAAKSSLLGGGGVDGAIHRAGGPAILEECRKLGGCDTGDAKVTGAGKLPAQYVIHTVGPMYSDGTRGEATLLRSCYRRSMEIAGELNLRSIAFPAVSCGLYGYPIDAAAEIAVGTVLEILERNDSIKRAVFVLFSEDVLEHFEAARRKLD
jgi:O-acetyl-ADP-ribose deacetylase (regulator of RNase III)